MRTTIDRAGRLVIPKALRDHLGLEPGPVEVVADGAALRVEPITEDVVVDRDGFLVIPSTGATVTDELVQALRHADQR
jgi:AbrB family looped-hinge helix DNA binding protein